MIVEDDEKLRKTATNVLRKQGYEVVEADSATEALNRLSDLHHLDLLFTNIVLPGGMNGLALAQEVCRQRINTRLLFTSGDTQDAVVREGLPGGNVELLAKPYRGNTLVRKVRELLNRPLDHTAD